MHKLYKRAKQGDELRDWEKMAIKILEVIKHELDKEIPKEKPEEILWILNFPNHQRIPFQPAHMVAENYIVQDQEMYHKRALVFLKEEEIIDSIYNGNFEYDKLSKQKIAVRKFSELNNLDITKLDEKYFKGVSAEYDAKKVLEFFK